MRLDAQCITYAEFVSLHEKAFSTLLPTIEAFSTKNHLITSHLFDLDPHGPSACYCCELTTDMHLFRFISICAQDPLVFGPNFYVNAVSKHYHQRWDYCSDDGPETLYCLMAEAMRVLHEKEFLRQSDRTVQEIAMSYALKLPRGGDHAFSVAGDKLATHYKFNIVIWDSGGEYSKHIPFYRVRNMVWVTDEYLVVLGQRSLDEQPGIYVLSSIDDRLVSMLPLSLEHSSIAAKPGTQSITFFGDFLGEYGLFVCEIPKLEMEAVEWFRWYISESNIEYIVSHSWNSHTGELALAGVETLHVLDSSGHPVHDSSDLPQKPSQQRIQIYLLNADTGLWRVTNSEGSTNPVWSPDGLNLVYLRSSRGGIQLWCLEVSTRSVHQLDSGPVIGTPVFAPDGTLFYTRVNIATDDERSKHGISSVSIRLP